MNQKEMLNVIRKMEQLKKLENDDYAKSIIEKCEDILIKEFYKLYE